MQCSICTLDKPTITCVSCARITLWQQRYDLLLRTTARDALSDKIHEHLESPSGQTATQQRESAQLKLTLHEIRSQKASLATAREAAVVRVEELRRENERRRAVLEGAMGLRDQLEAEVSSVQRETKRRISRSKTLHGRIAEARGYLCREAAGLYGLRQKRRKSGRVEYVIGGVAIPNYLTDLNTHPHQQIATSLSHLSHLLLLTAHYLSLKLPNEILLPTQSHPFTQIRGTLNARHTVTRPLSLPAPLSTLSRDNPASHTKFIEGISLLAINIAYTCFTQGLEINDVDAVCAPGANLWSLLVSRDTPVPAFGRMSHGSCLGNLATAGRMAGMARFRVGFKSVVEKVRNTLQGETIVADWDLVGDVLGGGRNAAAGGGTDKEVDGEDGGKGGREGRMPGWTRIRAPGEER
ncbi:UV radiation resistance protein and autophagy-related subunit 14-domain-containing protein [Tuber indicum]|nr:UV radiation resistance protein and autophagy-related subunit 14-domain-containing protein [Tuber indicum]